MPSAPNIIEENIGDALDAKYLEERRQIIAKFEEGAKILEFFPKLILQKQSTAMLKSIINGNGYVIEDKEKAIEIKAKNYSRLVEIASEVRKHTIVANIIEAERQFLLLNSNNYRKAVLKAFYSELEIENLPIKPKEIINSLIETDEREAYEFARKIAIAKILNVKLEKLNLISNPAEIFAENLFFKAGMPFNQTKKFEINKEEINFERALELFGIMQAYNIAPDSINCKHKECKQRILASSIVEVKAKSDGIFIDDPLQGVDELFHYNYGNKKQRIVRKRRFYLQKIPVGPLSRTETKNICLADANRDYVEILKVVVPQNSCRIKSKIISELENFLRAIKELEEIRDCNQRIKAKEKALIAWNIDAKILYINAAIDVMKQLFAAFIELAYNYVLGFEFGLALRATEKIVKRKETIEECYP